jgi:hypothetical protein
LSLVVEVVQLAAEQMAVVAVLVDIELQLVLH